MFSWGWGIHGQLGHGNPDNVSVPKEILALKGHMVVTVRGGQGHSVVLTRKVWCTRIFLLHQIDLAYSHKCFLMSLPNEVDHKKIVLVFVAP